MCVRIWNCKKRNKNSVVLRKTHLLYFAQTTCRHVCMTINFLADVFTCLCQALTSCVCCGRAGGRNKSVCLFSSSYAHFLYCFPRIRCSPAPTTTVKNLANAPFTGIVLTLSEQNIVYRSFSVITFFVLLGYSPHSFNALKPSVAVVC